MHVLCSLVLWSALLVARSVANPCPNPDSIRPCTCDIQVSLPTTRCESIYQNEVLRNVFSATGDHPLPSMDIKFSVLSYFPASALKEKGVKELSLTLVHMVGLFDRLPEPNNKLERLILGGSRFLRGIEWALLKNFNNLKMLVIEEVTTKSLSKEFTENIPSSILELIVKNTSLSRLHDSAFSRMHNLIYLDLEDGRIRTLKRTMFPSENVIEKLNFNKNRISDLPDDIFSDMPKLERVTLDNNLFTTISEPAFKAISVTGLTITLSGNNINCNCQIKWMLKNLEDAKWNLVAQCHKPEEFKGRNLGGRSSGISERDLDYCDDQ